MISCKMAVFREEHWICRGKWPIYTHPEAVCTDPDPISHAPRPQLTRPRPRLTRARLALKLSRPSFPPRFDLHAYRRNPITRRRSFFPHGFFPPLPGGDGRNPGWCLAAPWHSHSRDRLGDLDPLRSWGSTLLLSDPRLPVRGKLTVISGVEFADSSPSRTILIPPWSGRGTRCATGCRQARNAR